MSRYFITLKQVLRIYLGLNPHPHLGFSESGFLLFQKKLQKKDAHNPTQLPV